MIRTAIALAFCAAGAAADPWSPTWLSPWSVGIVVEHPTGDDVTIGDYDGTWDRAERIALEIRYEDDLEQVATVGGGLYAGWDRRSGEFADAGTLDSRALVLGLLGGAGIHLVGPGPRRPFEPVLLLQGRAGVAFIDGEIEDYPSGSGFGDAELPGLAYEIGVVADLRMTVARRFDLLVGAAWTAWFANQATAIIIDGGATVAVEADYAGSDLSLRWGAGWRF
jgi:hypothetical protein